MKIDKKKIQSSLAKIADFQNSVLLAAAYFLIVLPYALFFGAARFFQKIKSRRSTWIEHPRKKVTLDDMRRQY